MVQIEVNVQGLLVNTTFKGDVPDEVLEAAQKVLNTTSGEERDLLYEIGDRWVNSGDDSEIVLRSAVFDSLAGLGYDSIPLKERGTNLDSDTGNSGGRRSNHIYPTSYGTGLSGQEKWPNKKEV